MKKIALLIASLAAVAGSFAALGQTASADQDLGAGRWLGPVSGALGQVN